MLKSKHTFEKIYMKRSLIFVTFCILLSGAMGHAAPITIPSDDKIVSLTPSPHRGQALESWKMTKKS